MCIIMHIQDPSPYEPNWLNWNITVLYCETFVKQEHNFVTEDLRLLFQVQHIESDAKRLFPEHSSQIQHIMWILFA